MKGRWKGLTRLSLPRLFPGRGPGPGRAFSLPLPSLTGERLALSFEGTTLRLLCWRGREVRSWANAPFNPTLLRGGFVASPPALAQVLRGVLAGNHIKAKRVTVALPGHQSFQRIINLPRARGLDAATVLPREARRLMSYSPDNSYLFWQALNSGPATLRFFALVVPRDPLLRLLETVTLAGLKTRVVDLKPLALARAANQPRALIANAENNSLDFVIVADHVPVLFRTVHLGEETLFPEDLLPRLVDDLVGFISFYNDTNRDNPLPDEEPILLCGAFASYPDFAAAVQEATGRPVQGLSPLLRYPSDFPVAEMAVPLGLALKDL